VCQYFLKGCDFTGITDQEVIQVMHTQVMQRLNHRPRNRYSTSKTSLHLLLESAFSIWARDDKKGRDGTTKDAGAMSWLDRAGPTTMLPCSID
jgi:hypothetical protein